MFYGNLYTLLCSYFVNFPARLKCFTETYARPFVHILQNFPAHLRCFTEIYMRSFDHIMQIFLHILNVHFTETYTRSFVHTLYFF